jgi:hypothetical protein
VVINDKNCVLTLPGDNTTFRLIFIKPFYVLNNELVNIKYHELERDIKTNNIIIIDTFKLINAPKRDKGRLYKVLDINIFL